MSEAKPTFEENLNALETLVAQLEKGDVPLEEALDKFKTGVELSKQLQGTLESAEKTLTKVMSDDGQEQAFETADGQNDNGQ